MCTGAPGECVLSMATTDSLCQWAVPSFGNLMSVLLAEQTSLNQWLICVEGSIPQLHINNCFAFGYRQFWDETYSLSASFLWKWIESCSVMSDSLWPPMDYTVHRILQAKILGNSSIYIYIYLYLYMLVNSNIILFLWDESKVTLPSEILKLSFWRYFFPSLSTFSLDYCFSWDNFLVNWFQSNCWKFISGYPEQ